MWTDGHPSRRETSSPAARRSITSLSNVTPSACEFRRNRQLATVMIHCKYIRHGTRIPKASSATNDRADLEQVHRTRRDSRIEGQPLRSVPSDSAGQAHYAMRRNSSQEMRNLMARTASSRLQNGLWWNMHYIQQVCFAAAGGGQTQERFRCLSDLGPPRTLRCPPRSGRDGGSEVCAPHR